MYSFKIFIFLWILIGAIFCLYALSTDKIKVLVNERPLLETAIAMMYQKETKIESESQCNCFMTHWCLSQKDGLYI